MILLKIALKQLKSIDFFYSKCLSVKNSLYKEKDFAKFIRPSFGGLFCYNQGKLLNPEPMMKNREENWNFGDFSFLNTKKWHLKHFWRN